MQFQLPDIDFSELEIREIGSWPLILRIGVIALCVVLAMVATYFLVFSSELSDLGAEQTKVRDKYKEYKDQYNEAVNLDAYKKQMHDMQNAYQDYINELPSDSNIPELIDSISKIGEHDGLTFNFIKIGEPKLVSGFYMAMPLSLNVTGGYHNFGLFVSDIGKLARIVTVGDFTIKSAQTAKGETSDFQLTMDIQAQTYWLASLSELEKQNAATTTKTGKSAPAAPSKGLPVVHPPHGGPAGAVPAGKGAGAAVAPAGGT